MIMASKPAYKDQAVFKGVFNLFKWSGDNKLINSYHHQRCEILHTHNNLVKITIHLV